MIMTDQDHDGSHIKGLLLNLIHSEPPELLKLNYINCMVTPIIKASKNKEIKSFYTLTDYGNWKDFNNGKWNIKYYKCLISTSKGAKSKYFKD